jgi:DNA-binding protein H-NS
MNLDELSIDELIKLQGRIANEIKQRKSRQKKEVLGKLKAIAAASGYTLEELVAASASAGRDEKAVRSGAAKYRHPSDPSLSWTGRGKRPRWVGECLAQGKTLADLAI